MKHLPNSAKALHDALLARAMAQAAVREASDAIAVAEAALHERHPDVRDLRGAWLLFAVRNRETTGGA